MHAKKNTNYCKHQGRKRAKGSETVRKVSQGSAEYWKSRSRPWTVLGWSESCSGPDWVCCVWSALLWLTAQIRIPGLRMLLVQAVFLLLVLPSHGQDTTTREPRGLIPLPKGACPGWMAGIPGHPGHNGIPGRDGRDGTPGEKGEKGDSGKNKVFGFLCHRLLLGRGGLLELYGGRGY